MYLEMAEPANDKKHTKVSAVVGQLTVVYVNLFPVLVTAYYNWGDL